MVKITALEPIPKVTALAVCCAIGEEGDELVGVDTLGDTQEVVVVVGVGAIAVWILCVCVCVFVGGVGG
jgi:hypothetical protein